MILMMMPMEMIMTMKIMRIAMIMKVAMTIMMMIISNIHTSSKFLQLSAHV